MVTHGEMANGVMGAIRIIVGEDEEKERLHIQKVILGEGESPETLVIEITQRVEQMAQKGFGGVLILTDLYGSSTTNAGVKTMLSENAKVNEKFQIAVVTGFNLPMVLELIPVLNDAESIKELTKLAVETGMKSIINVSDELMKRKKKRSED